MRFRCPYGHLETDRKGRPVPMVHASRDRCSIYVQLRNQGKVDVFGRALPGIQLPADLAGSSPAPASAPAAGAEAGAAPQPPAAPAEAPKKEGLLKRLKSGLEVGYKRVTTTGALAPGLAPEQDANWEISNETSLRFWSTIFGFIETITNLVCGFLEIPKVPEEVFIVDPGQEFVFRTALKGFTTQILQKVFRAKSPEHADQIVAGLSGLLGFGMMGMKIVLHFMIHLPKSPKIVKWKANRALALAERKKLDQAKALEEARRAPPPPAAPRPTGIPG